MLCDECKKNEANFHAVTNINGFKSERYLCGECQKKLYGGAIGIGGLSGGGAGIGFGGVSGGFKLPEFGELFGTLFGGGASGVAGAAGGSPRPAPRTEYCPVCGTSGQEFAASGFAGCPECYKVFRRINDSIIAKVQAKDYHTGKIPSGFIPRLNAGDELRRLTGELERARADERYEDAAVLRDRIRKIKGEAL